MATNNVSLWQWVIGDGRLAPWSGSVRSDYSVILQIWTQTCDPLSPTPLCTPWVLRNLLTNHRPIPVQSVTIYHNISYTICTRSCMHLQKNQTQVTRHPCQWVLKIFLLGTGLAANGHPHALLYAMIFSLLAHPKTSCFVLSYIQLIHKAGMTIDILFQTIAQLLTPTLKAEC